MEGADTRVASSGARSLQKELLVMLSNTYLLERSEELDSFGCGY